MAYPEVNEEVVYLTAGAAVPAVIERMFLSLMNDGFTDAYKSLLQATKEFGYALSDIVTELSLQISKTEFPDQVVSHLMDKLSTIEFRLSHGVSEKLQLGALVSAFIVARSMMASP